MSSSDCIVTDITNSSNTNYSNSSNTSNNSNSSTHYTQNFKFTGSSNSSCSNTEKQYAKTELEKLIRIIKNGIRKKEPGIKYIKYPELLVTALEELNSMIGLHRIKESAAIQTVKLIENLKNGEKSMQMLNTILCGNAGVGKTTVGVKLASIWFALGFLDPDFSSNESSTSKKTYFNSPKFEVSPIIILVIAWLGTYIIQFISYAYNNLGLFWLSLIFGFFILILIIYYFSANSITKIIKEYTIKTETEKLKIATERDIISVVSRNDFVAEYLDRLPVKLRSY